MKRKKREGEKVPAARRRWPDALASSNRLPRSATKGEKEGKFLKREGKLR